MTIGLTDRERRSCVPISESYIQLRAAEVPSSYKLNGTGARGVFRQPMVSKTLRHYHVITLLSLYLT
ncbi:hypothetical protein WN55_09534 [Dufourea novaeangliae]|uniref:Uncharacterized protein n=1 Tax=Dufourea novaeangliae TaxID=178035 RepID=A0A154NYI5_DUFNO|nr:hypothetical protein WN55_09534 [Dufourea novaeangliae]